MAIAVAIEGQGDERHGKTAHGIFPEADQAIAFLQGGTSLGTNMAVACEAVPSVANRQRLGIIIPQSRCGRMSFFVAEAPCKDKWAEFFNRC